MIVTAICLLPKITLPVPNLNDAFHLVIVRHMSRALAAGRGPLDFRLPETELGFAPAISYQNLPHLAALSANIG